MVNSATFARNLQILLDKKGKTRNEFCKDLGLKYPTVSMWLNENSKEKLPRIESLLMLCDYFGVTIHNLIDDGNIPESSGTNRVPCYDDIRCGLPINYVDGSITDYVDCPSGIRADLSVKAKGDSMNAIGILDGDLVFIKQQQDFEDGDICAISIGDSVILKQCFHFEGGLRLKARNFGDNYADQIYSAKQLEDKGARIIGKLAGSIRKF